MSPKLVQSYSCTQTVQSRKLGRQYFHKYQLPDGNKYGGKITIFGSILSRPRHGHGIDLCLPYMQINRQLDRIKITDKVNLELPTIFVGETCGCSTDTGTGRSTWICKGKSERLYKCNKLQHTSIHSIITTHVVLISRQKG